MFEEYNTEYVFRNYDWKYQMHLLNTNDKENHNYIEVKTAAIQEYNRFIGKISVTVEITIISTNL